MQVMTAFEVLFKLSSTQITYKIKLSLYRRIKINTLFMILALGHKFSYVKCSEIWRAKICTLFPACSWVSAGKRQRIQAINNNRREGKMFTQSQMSLSFQVLQLC